MNPSQSETHDRTVPPSPAIIPGLEGVPAAATRLSRVDGLAGELVIAGYPLEELAGRAEFEQTAFLLWNDRLPDAGELAALRADLAARRGLPAPVLALLRAAADRGQPVMDALRMAAGSLDIDASQAERNDLVESARTITARLPVVVASYWRLRQRREPVAPAPDLGHVANYLYMLSGEPPSAARVRGLETYFNTVSDHGFNASTFTARVILSTRSDIYSAVTGAIGAMKGPAHGGAPGPALDTVLEIGRPERAEAVLQAKLDAGERLMGFGHRVYKVRDPRAVVLAEAARQLYTADGDLELYELARHVEATAIRLLEARKPGRNLQTNVEFYTALLLHGLGLPTELFTPSFSVARAAGWTAHCIEQAGANRLFRPESVYVGAEGRRWPSSGD
ncbi:MAG: citrate synthase/methylcitrate synthase [Caldilineae bacterium]|nr:citrate synthase/methylcitrate synthase [Chloroflexota bacterium]MCB9176814.1 citrate synthase/methylcitrate synthase [Caldilineae bacterium]